MNWNQKMSETAYRRTTCRLCDSKNLEVGLPLTPTPLADAYVNAAGRKQPQQVYPLELFRCADCGFVQLL